MRILTTGGTGFVGRALLNRLVAEGHEGVVLTRSVQKARQKLGNGVSFFKWDGNAEPPEECWKGVEAVIHLAGESIAEKRWTAEQKKRIRDSRVEGTRHLVAAVKKLSVPPRVFLSASAIGFYGDTGQNVVDETAPAGTGFLAEVCKEWEEALRPLEGICRSVSLRTGMVLGKDGGALAPLQKVFRWGAGGALGSGDQGVSWIHLHDLVSLYTWLLTAPVAGAVNGVAPQFVSNAAFVKELAETLHAPHFLRAPSFALKMVMGEMASVVLEGQRVRPAVALAKGFAFRFTSLRSALIDLLGKASGENTSAKAGAGK